MKKYIDRDEFAKRLNENVELTNPEEQEWVKDECIRQAYAMPSVNVGEWISVRERLPEVAGRAYLVWDDVQKTVKKRFFYRIPPSIPLETYPYIREYFGNSADYKRYTHWMPLPEPPKGN